jgi:hypothetical protein
MWHRDVDTMARIFAGYIRKGSSSRAAGRFCRGAGCGTVAIQRVPYPSGVRAPPMKKARPGRGRACVG